MKIFASRGTGDDRDACYKYPQLKSKTKEEISRGTWRSARHFRLPRITPFIFRQCGRPSTLSHDVRWCTLDYKPGVTSTKDKSFAIETPPGPRAIVIIALKYPSPRPDCDSHYNGIRLTSSRVVFLLRSRVANNSVRLAETAINPSLFAIFVKCDSSESLFFCYNITFDFDCSRNGKDVKRRVMIKKE